MSRRLLPLSVYTGDERGMVTLGDRTIVFDKTYSEKDYFDRFLTETVEAAFSDKFKDLAKTPMCLWDLPDEEY